MRPEQATRILIVDDTSHIVSLLKHYIRKGGYEVVEASDGREALEVVRLEAPDLILLDAVMPGIDGFDVCQELRGNSKTRFIPIIMVTALNEISDKVKALESGVDDFLTKPVDETILVAKVRSLLRAKHEREELEHLKADFASILAHDLRAPLTNILGFAELLLTQKGRRLHDQQRQFVEIIFDSGEKMLDQINNFLDYSKIEAGRFQLQRFKTDIRLSIDSAIQSVSVLAEKKNLSILKKFEDKVPLVYIDGQKIEQVIVNLLSNSVKYTTEGGSIVVSVGVAEGFVEVAVEDTGVEISREEIRQLSRPYSQTRVGLSMRTRGTGLELLVAKMVIEAHSGIMAIEGKTGLGSKFKFTIPLVLEHQTDN
jgi:signal transduction histidine kinase